MRRLLLVSLVLSATFACVPKSKYDELLAENADLKSKVSSLEGDLEQLEAEKAALDAKLEETRRKLSSKVAEAGALAADIEEMQRALRELELRRAQAEASLQAFRDLVSKFQAMIDAGTLRVRVIDGRMVVELATDILFARGSATLSPEGKKTLAEVAAVLASIPGRDFQVAGHTDNDPIATEKFPSNWDLGAARSITVTRLLVDSGLPADRVSASSYADTVPVVANDTAEGKAANRRIEIVVVPDLSLMPGYDELQRLASGK
jgi:chemotaxis protein MotB